MYNHIVIVMLYNIKHVIVSLVRPIYLVLTHLTTCSGHLLYCIVIDVTYLSVKKRKKQKQKQIHP